MPKLNHQGPEGSGPKTGRKLGKCNKAETELAEIGKIGIGQGLRRNSGGGKGKGKRLQYNKTINNKENKK